MKFCSHSENQMRDIEKFINKEGIQKEDIVNIFKDSDGTYTVNYFERVEE